MVLKDFEKLLEPFAKDLVTEKNALFGPTVKDLSLDGLRGSLSAEAVTLLTDAVHNKESSVNLLQKLPAYDGAPKHLTIDADVIYSSLYKPVPKSYWFVAYSEETAKAKESFYAHYCGNFFKVTLTLSTVTGDKVPVSLSAELIDYESIKDEKIYDFTNRAKGWELADALNKDIRDVLTLLLQYEHDCDFDYNKTRYQKEVEVVKEVSDKYDEELSLTKEESAAMYKWQHEHAKKYHKGNAASGGASPVSFFNISYGCCSIGSRWECECTKCKELYEAEKDEKKKKKLRDQYLYTIRDNM